MAMRLYASIWLSGVLLLIAQLCNAQQLQLSPEEYMDGSQRYVKVLGSVGDKTACFLENYDGYRILWYDSAMRKIATSKLDFLDRGTDQFRFFIKGGVIQVFYQRKKRAKRTLWAARVVPLHKDTIVPVLIDSIKLKGAWDKQRFNVYNTGHANRTAYSNVNYDNRNDVLKFKVISLDGRFEKVQEVDESLNDVSFHTLLDVAVGKKDGLHLFFAEPSKQVGRWNQLLVGSKSLTQSELHYKKNKLEGKLLGNPRFERDDKNNSLQIGSLVYGGANQAASSLGRFVYDMSNQDWQQALFADISTINQDKNNNLNDVRLRNFISKKDGGCSFILESSFEELHRRNRNMSMMANGMVLGGGTYSVYHDDEIHVVSLSSKGAVDWYEVIPKSQQSSDANGRFQSFGMLKYPMGNVFLFNDQQNNGNRFITAFLSNTGDLKLRQFSSSLYKQMEQDDMYLRSATQIASNEIVFPVIKRGALSFAKIIF